MDPISGKAVASASQIGAADLSRVDRAGGAESSGGKSFHDVMESTKPQGASDPQKVGQAEPPPEVKPTAETQKTEPAAKRLDDFIRSVSKDEESMDRAMKKAMRGDAMDSGDLLKLQATMYSYAQKVDLSTKIVEKTTGGLKQMMNTQV